MASVFIPTRFVWRFGGSQVCAGAAPPAWGACSPPSLQPGSGAHPHICQATCNDRSSVAKAAGLSAAGSRRRPVAAPEPCRFAAASTTAQVHLCGSFTRWVETVPMQPVEGQPGTFAVVVHLPPG